MAIVAVSIAPLGTGSTSVGEYVAEMQKILAADGRVKYRLDPMFTTLEGDLAVCLEVIHKLHESVFAAGAQRVGTLIKIDDRRDRVVHLEDKIRSVEEKLR